MGIVYKVWKGPYALGQTKQITCLLKNTYILQSNCLDNYPMFVLDFR